LELRLVQEGAATSNRQVAKGVPSLLRAINERSILELLIRVGPLSRGRLSSETGLSKPTVGIALQNLRRAGLVNEAGWSTGSRGPKAVLYELNPRAGWVVGVDIGREWVRAAIADVTGRVVARRDEPARVRTARTLISQVASLAHDLASDAGVRWPEVTHATVGSPGVFDPEHGQVELAPNLPGWSRQGLVDIVRRELGVGISFENDVNLAALGEQWRGLGKDVRNFLYLWIGTGVGMGLILDGRLYRGTTGRAGEVGYMPLGPAGPDHVNRRRGSFEEAVAATGVLSKARELGMTDPTSAKQVFDEARRGDPLAQRVVEMEAARIALGIAAIVPVVDPELVIVGGGIGRNGDLLIEPMERELRRLSPFPPRLAESALGEDAVLQGAVAVAVAAAQERLFTRAGGGEVAG
jgi:predicted NBD/HSP70 family sugar kinase